MDNDKTLASELIAEQKARARRWRTAFIFSVALWLCTAAAIIILSCNR